MLTKKNFIYIKLVLPKINWLRLTVPIALANQFLNDAIDLLGFIKWMIRVRNIENYIAYLYKGLELLKEFRNCEDGEFMDMHLGKENIGIKIKLI
ncbi:hypothetical protein [Clostridium sp. B9]|uniref:hypothetical protein n=1 Tax=Clostridium sp. B9 TaxID=3423224 RepID=UPI003D2ED5E8